MPFDAAPQLNFDQNAHVYQKNGAAHLWNSVSFDGVAVLWLDPGYGKTMIVLHTFKALYDAGAVKNMLIVAPLRVMQTVWAQEIENWSSLHGLRAARLHGRKKEKQLERRDVQIWLINYEGMPWAVKMAKEGKLPQCDVICFDEIRRMKNAQGKRFKAAKPLVAMARFKWGLTGTPASNGLMDLFGQFLILDGGIALGKYITKYRQNYFEKGYDGFTWLPRPGAKEAIEKRIAPYVYRADGFLDLPEFVYDDRKIVLTDKARKTYQTLKRDLIAEHEGEKLTAANAAVLFGKLKQMAGGRVYDEDGKVVFVHDGKKEALEELVEELGDEQLLIAYQYNHELQQIRDVLGEDVPYLGAGVNEKTAMSHVDAWNRKEIQFMAAHPASAGHGLNLQKGGAHHILWFGPTVDLDHYIQFNDRLRRQGNVASSVVVHQFVAERTADEIAIVSRIEKDGLQSAVLRALTGEFGEHILIAEEIKTEDLNVMSNLEFKSDGNQGQPQQPPANPFGQPQGQPAPAPQGNPFGQQQAAPPPQQQPAPQQNPFGQAAGQPAQPQPAPQQPAPQANPFAQGQAGQGQAIQQDVAAPPVPQPEPASAPPNPFAQGGQTSQPPADNGNGQTVEGTAHEVQQPQPQYTQPAQDNTQVEQTTGSGPATHDAPAAQQVAAAPASGMVPFYTHIPADKMDKVLAAIGRALK